MHLLNLTRLVCSLQSAATYRPVAAYVLSGESRASAAYFGLFVPCLGGNKGAFGADQGETCLWRMGVDPGFHETQTTDGYPNEDNSLCLSIALYLEI